MLEYSWLFVFTKFDDAGGEVDVAKDAVYGVVEFVGDAAGDFADGREALGLSKLVFGVGPFGNVFDDNGAAGRAAVVFHRHADDMQQTSTVRGLVLDAGKFRSFTLDNSGLQIRSPVAPDPLVSAGGERGVHILTQINRLSGLGIGPRDSESVVVGDDADRQRGQDGFSEARKRGTTDVLNAEAGTWGGLRIVLLFHFSRHRCY